MNQTIRIALNHQNKPVYLFKLLSKFLHAFALSRRKSRTYAILSGGTLQGELYGRRTYAELEPACPTLIVQRQGNQCLQQIKRAGRKSKPRCIP
jgi:hypothetical protein